MRMRDPKRSPSDHRHRSDGFGRNVASHRAARQARHEAPAPPSHRRRTPIYGFVAFGMIAAFAAPLAIQSTGLVDLRLPTSPSTATASPSVTHISDHPVARPVSLCPPQFRRGGGGTCVTDGDSGVEAGRAWRLTSSNGGVDAPEIGSPGCSAERSAGERARNRLLSLMSGGYTMDVEGTDRYDRQLVVVTLADGRDAGEVLIEEGLAQEWPNSGNPWCRRLKRLKPPSRR